MLQLKGAEFFRDVWDTHIYPVIREDLEALLQETPSRLKARKDKAEEDPEKAEKKTRQRLATKTTCQNDVAFAFDPPECPVREELQQMLEELKRNTECRNVYMNLSS